MWPNANVAVATGASTSLVVIDIDPRHEGDQSLVRIATDYGPIPTTLTCNSGGGGKHIYFFCPDGSVRTRTALLPGIDVRAQGSYIIAPPSRHVSGQPYVWQADLHHVKELLGHANISTTDTYLNAGRVHLRESILRLEAEGKVCTNFAHPPSSQPKSGLPTVRHSEPKPLIN
jgi:hypothetical protein